MDLLLDLLDSPELLTTNHVDDAIHHDDVTVSSPNGTKSTDASASVSRDRSMAQRIRKRMFEQKKIAQQR